MQVLVDGHNLMYAMHADRSGRPAGMGYVCRVLSQWAARRRAEVSIVFDGPDPPGKLAEQMRQPRLQIHFSRDKSADEVIEQMIEEAKAPGAMLVVTSDHAIQSVARAHRCRCVDSEAFVRQMNETPRPKETEPPPASEKPQSVTPEETEEWLRQLDDYFNKPLDDYGMTDE